MRARALTMVALLSACGAASPSAATAPAAETRPAPGSAVRWTPVHLTQTPPERDATCPACFEVSGLPAISRDGQSIAAFVRIPTYQEQDGGWFPVDGYALVVVDPSTGVERSRVVLRDRADLELDRTTLTACCDDEEEESCDPDLCAPDPDLAAASHAERRARLATRLESAHALLDHTEWHALTPIATELGDEDDDAQSFSLVEPDADQWLFTHAIEPSTSCEGCSVVEGDAYRDAETGTLLVVVILADDSQSQGEARCFVETP